MWKTVVAGMPQWWERSPPTSVAQVQIPASTPHVGWVCCWFSLVSLEVFLRVLRFSPLVKNRHYQIQTSPGIRQTTSVDVIPLNHYLFIYLLITIDFDVHFKRKFNDKKVTRRFDDSMSSLSNTKMWIVRCKLYRLHVEIFRLKDLFILGRTQQVYFYFFYWWLWYCFSLLQNGCWYLVFSY